MSEPLAYLVEHLTASDLVIFLVFLGFVYDRIADSRGWYKSGKTLRTENVDLLRRNGELEATVARDIAELASRGERIAAQDTQIELLKSRDQLAVLKVLENHETQAERRSMERRDAEVVITGLLERIANGLEAAA